MSAELATRSTRTAIGQWSGRVPDRLSADLLPADQLHPVAYGTVERPMRIKTNCDLTGTVTAARRARDGIRRCWVRNGKELNSATAQMIPFRNETAEASRNICEESAIMPGQESHVKLAIWDSCEFKRRSGIRRHGIYSARGSSDACQQRTMQRAEVFDRVSEE